MPNFLQNIAIFCFINFLFLAIYPQINFWIFPSVMLIFCQYIRSVLAGRPDSGRRMRGHGTRAGMRPQVKTVHAAGTMASAVRILILCGAPPCFNGRRPPSARGTIPVCLASGCVCPGNSAAYIPSRSCPRCSNRASMEFYRCWWPPRTSAGPVRWCGPGWRP